MEYTRDYIKSNIKRYLRGVVMTNKVIYTRDLLYPTENENEPGIIHLKVLGLDKDGRIPVIIEGKTRHFPGDYISSIIDVMQKDIFDRLDIDVRNKVDVIIKTNENNRNLYDNKKYVKVVHINGRDEHKYLDEI
ncbi:UNVERIFIED_CONTAM: hypothetical protein Cloal_4404 [Acetivibrio alkalicellulosi]